MAIDWLRVAEPTEDGYGARVALHLAATRLSPSRRELYVPPPTRTAELIFDGAVAVERCYPPEDIPAHLVDAPLDHPTIAQAAELVRCWPAGFRRVQLVIDSLHPLFDTRHPAAHGRIKGPCASFSAEWRFATLAVTVEYPLPLATACVRHAAHQLLRALGVGTRRSNALVLNRARDVCAGPGELAGLGVIEALHQTFALAHEMGLVTALLERLPAESMQVAQSLRRAAKSHARSLREARQILGATLELDREGEQLVAGFFSWCSRLCEGLPAAAAPAARDLPKDAAMPIEGSG
jgi:hypothetical protein